MIEWSSKNWCKTVKADVKQQEIKELVAISYDFTFKSTFKTWNKMQNSYVFFI